MPARDKGRARVYAGKRRVSDRAGASFTLLRLSTTHSLPSPARRKVRESAILTIWLRFCCDCGPVEPAGGGGTAFCCGGMPLCGGSPALGGPLPTLMARPAPGPGGGPDIVQSPKSPCSFTVLCADGSHSLFTIHLEDGLLAYDMDQAAGIGRSVCGMGRRGRPRRLVCVEWFVPLQLAGLLFDFLGVEPQLRADGRVRGCCGSCPPMH